MARLVLLEPDTILGSIYQKTLERQGHTVMWCQTAQTAISSLDTKIPDLAIIELQLPMHNGIEFLYELRSYIDWQKLPVIILSHVSPLRRAVHANLWQQLRVTAYHYKPTTKLSDLVYSVERILQS